jgi:hypothetical protein
MKLGEFIKDLSHNNVIRLVYKNKGGHEVVLDDWNDVSMDWEINKAQGKFKDYVNNEVLGLATISFKAGDGIHHTEALNIIIERLESQPNIEELVKEETINHESMSEEEKIETDVEKDFQSILIPDSYWVGNTWIQPPVKIEHGDLVDVGCDNYPTMLGRYIGKGYGVVELYDYSSGIKHVIGKVLSRGLDRNPRLISDEKLLEFVED